MQPDPGRFLQNCNQRERMSEEGRSVLIFRIGDRRYGLEASVVESVVRMVEITPLPGGPAAVRGLIEVGGEIVPVFAVERRFGLRERPWGPSDFLVLARSPRRRVALAAEEVFEVREAGEDWLDKPEVGAPAESVAGVVRTTEGLVLIQDLDTFLFPEEERQLEEALREIQ
jgi:purine-binding chemotaxis protein CheW